MPAGAALSELQRLTGKGCIWPRLLKVVYLHGQLRPFSLARLSAERLPSTVISAGASKGLFKRINQGAVKTIFNQSLQAVD